MMACSDHYTTLTCSIFITLTAFDRSWKERREARMAHEELLRVRLERQEADQARAEAEAQGMNVHLKQ